MMISRAEIASAVSAYKTVKRKSSVVASLTFDALDSFERSETAAALGELFSAGGDAFYRNALVEHLQRQISEGHYFVPSDAIVEKLLGRLIVEAAVAA
jgi:anti-sigma28 factor (negative regulator of flagellin synthesis)